MIGMVLVTHGKLAKEFLAATEHVVGPQKKVELICIGPDDDMEQRQAEILEAAKKVDSGSGVVVITDMFGGTPSNLAISIMNKGNYEVIAGMNLPMLIKIASLREASNLDDLVHASCESGRKYINIASKILSETDH